MCYICLVAKGMMLILNVKLWQWFTFTDGSPSPLLMGLHSPSCIINLLHFLAHNNNNNNFIFSFLLFCLFVFTWTGSVLWYISCQHECVRGSFSSYEDMFPGRNLSWGLSWGYERTGAGSVIENECVKRSPHFYLISLYCSSLCSQHLWATKV